MVSLWESRRSTSSYPPILETQVPHEIFENVMLSKTLPDWIERGRARTECRKAVRLPKFYRLLKLLNCNHVPLFKTKEE